VTKGDLRDLIWRKRDGDPEKGIKGHEQAALAIRNHLKRLWAYAMVCDLTDKNPLDGIPPSVVAEHSERNRALKPPEIKAFLQALAMAHISPEIKAALLLILLTLTRKSEVLLAQWDEFDLDKAEWALPEAHSKMDTPLVIPLSFQVVEILRQQRERHPNATIVFPMRRALHAPMSASTLNRALSRVSARIEHFTVHDLRRTAATNLSEQEYNGDWIEKALNHKLKGVRGIYNRAQYATQRRQMLQAWADWLDQLKG
jgi:integrase